MERLTIEKKIGTTLWKGTYLLQGEPVPVAIRISEEPVDVEADNLRLIPQALISHVPMYVTHFEHDGKYYLVTRWLEGQSYAEILSQPEVSKADRRLLSSAARQATDALQDHGYAHRNVSLRHLFRDSRKMPVFLDLRTLRKTSECTKAELDEDYDCIDALIMNA